MWIELVLGSPLHSRSFFCFSRCSLDDDDDDQMMSMMMVAVVVVVVVVVVVIIRHVYLIRVLMY